MRTTTTPRTRALVLAAALAATFGAGLFAPRATYAAEPSAKEEAEAKKYFEAGRQAYEASRFGAAAAAFEEAYRYSPKPQVLFSLAQAHRQQYLVDRDPSRLRRAVELFRTYLKEVPMGGRHDHAAQHLADLEPQLQRVEAADKLAGRTPAPKLEAKTQLMITSRTPGAVAAFGDEEPSELPLVRDVAAGKVSVRVEAEGFIPETVEAVAVEGRLVVLDVPLKEIPALLTIDAPEGADIALDGRIVGTAPLPTALEVPSGRHLLVVMERGAYGASRELTLSRGEEREVKVKLDTTTQRKVAWWFLGGAGALVTAGAIAGGVALKAEGSAAAIDQQRLARQGLTAKDLEVYQRDLDRRDRFAPLSYGLLGAAGVVGATGLILYLVDTPRVDIERTPGSGARANLGPMVAPGAVGAALSGTF